MTAAVLGPFREAGVLSDADAHIAATLARLAGEHDPAVVLAAALAARAPRVGHVCVDLCTVAGSIVADLAGDDVDVAALPWPPADSWAASVAASDLVAGLTPPLVLDGTRLYAERYHVYERRVAEDLLRRAAVDLPPVRAVAAVVDALLGDGASEQRRAVDGACGNALTVLVGGPGTGKTTTVAALLASLVAADPDVQIALAAPTGKAAARLGVALRDAAQHLEPALAQRLASTEASTIHRLLGVRRWSSTRFHHDRHRPLPHDVVIVDEMSMVSLPLMAKLLDAVRPDARLVLVGDPGQLVSVEAGSVLGDVAGPETEADDVPVRMPLTGRVQALRNSRRFPTGSPIDRFAHAVRAGDADAAMAVLGERAGAAATSLDWLPVAPDDGDAIATIRDLVLPLSTSVCERAAAGDAAGALTLLEQTRILCAHRRGAFGVERWNARVDAWLTTAGARPPGAWYPGRPILVTANDYRLGLYNGDLGVVVESPAGRRVAFDSAGEAVRLVAPVRLEAVETVHAMTIHKSQGSEFDHVVVVLPPAGSRLATRELLYTAVTRARERVTVIGDEAALRAAIGARVVRASGLREALWST